MMHSRIVKQERRSRSSSKPSRSKSPKKAVKQQKSKKDAKKKSKRKRKSSTSSSSNSSSDSESESKPTRKELLSDFKGAGTSTSDRFWLENHNNMVKFFNSIRKQESNTPMELNLLILT